MVTRSPSLRWAPVWRSHKYLPLLSRNTSLHILLATSPNASKRTLSIANPSPWRLAIFTSSPPSRSSAVACSASVGPYYRLDVATRLTEVRYQFHECNVCCVLGVLTEAAILTDAHSLGTWQYKCYFNQGPDYPTAADPHHCSGPRASVQGGITASMPGGSFVGALLSGFLSDILGRKRAIQAGAVIWCIGSILVCASQDIAMLVVGRFINGLSVGICSAQVPVYISELAPPSKRGRVVGTQQWAITWGILIMYVHIYGICGRGVDWVMQVLYLVRLLVH